MAQAPTTTSSRAQQNDSLDVSLLPDSWIEVFRNYRGSLNNHNVTRIWFPAIYRQCEQYVLGARQMMIQLSDHDREMDTLPKELILQTRYALRFAFACLQNENVDVRRSIQNEAVSVHQWHKALIPIFSLSKNFNAKIQTLAARIFCNLVTDNAETSDIVLSLVKASPSPEAVSNRMVETLLHSATTPTTEWTNNWTSLILSSSGNRDALGAIVATLHNIVVAVSSEESCGHTLEKDDTLVLTLCRQMLPSKAIAFYHQESQADDDATEWISLLLEQLSQRGGLPAMYTAVGTKMVLPEHLVLLHCIYRAVEEFMVTRTSWHPLGGNVLDGIITTHMFLAHQAGMIRRMLEENKMEPNEIELSKAALTVVLEILASSLGDDSSSALATLRVRVGQETTLVQDTCNDLGLIVDVLSEKNQGLKARELKISHEEQRWITTLVRVLGNICFRCNQNQVIMRSTPVPMAAFLPHVEGDRTALHVLLSCTAFSYGCFTLREWAIVALRNVLEGNEENQTLVEKLQAQQPLQNIELEKMGLKVDMDEHGKVKIVPFS